MTFRLFALFVAAICASLSTLHAAAATATSAVPLTNTPAAAPVVPFPLAIAPEEITEKSEAILAQYPASGAQSATDATEADVRGKLTEIEPDLQLFSDETQRVLAKNPSLDRLRNLQRLGGSFSETLKVLSKQVTDRTKELGGRLAQIDSDKKIWSDTRGAVAASTTVVPPEIVKRVTDVLTRLDATRKALAANQTSLLKLQGEVTETNTPIADLLNQLDLAQSRALAQLFEQNAPPVWSSASVTQPSNALSWSKQVQSLEAYIRSEPGRFLIHGLLLALLTAFFYWLRGFARKWTAEEPGIKLASGIFETPLATAGLLSLIASPILYYPIAPRLLSALLGAVALVPSVILLRRLIAPRLFPILYALVIFFFLEEIRSVAAMSFAWSRAFFLAEILGAIVFLLWMLKTLRRTEPAQEQRRFGFAISLGIKVALSLLVICWAANVLGYVLLGNLLCEAVQRGATLALVLYAGIRIVGAILFIMTRLRPLSTLSMVRQHGPMMLERTARVLIWAAVLVWVLYVLELFSLKTPILAWMHGFLSTTNADNHVVLSLPGKLLTAALVGWAVYQLSVFLRFILETDFFPRLNLSAGIPYAISTSIHYAMLVVAFIGATYVLGIDMTKFTILVSALGVGVGFGLQNIINNFVSGLILLFERPVKIGDSIQSGDATGVVERIGIRASVLRTTSGSEMIVPNGNLISNSVTNWTWSSRERIIIVPFNVVRGPDVAHLMDLFTATAAAHPQVLKVPAPQVLVLSLGANLGFEVRAWTREINDWGVIRSELILAINAALTRENIALA